MVEIFFFFSCNLTFPASLTFPLRKLTPTKTIPKMTEINAKRTMLLLTNTNNRKNNIIVLDVICKIAITFPLILDSLS